MTQAPIRMRDAVGVRDSLASGALTSRAVVEACLARIDAREGEIQAWAWIDAEGALGAADAADALQRSGAALGPLHGMPVGVKDVIDTAGLPTECGTRLQAGRVPARDAALVSALKRAGAIVLGKTVTTELAFLHPGPTRNPHNARHTPGGSSSGSAAAVADGHVPLAIGTQTGGSVIRPAAFCGVAGFKPSFDAIPTEGVLVQSPTLDTIGVFAGDLGGAALLADALMTGATGLAEAAGQGAGTAPTVAFVRPPSWSEAHVDTQRAFAALSHALGGQMVEMALPTVFEAAADRRADINAAEMAACFAALDPAGLSAETTDMMARGRAVLATDYLAALSLREVLTAALQPIFAKADAILCPAALGPAPEGLSSTGSAIFNGLWTYCGVPAVTLPGLLARGGLPLGLQLVGPRGGDAALMRTAAWLERWIAAHRDAVSPASLRMA